MVGEKVSSKKNIYVSEKNAVLKISSNKKSDEYGYATTLNGNITKINGNTLDVTATENGSYIYVYILNKDGKYEKNYTAVNLILIELEDKTIYVGEGKTVNIDNIGKVNSDNLKFENIKDSSIIKIDNNTITGLKAGETSFTAKEKNTNATSLVTVKVVKLEFEKDYGTVLLGSSKSVKLTGINNGAVSVRTSDNKIATVSLVDNQVIITPKSVGNVDLTISETNANTSDTYKLKVANVILSPNGGEYVLPTNSTVATVKTLVKVENANSIETSWSDNLTKWEEIVNNKEIIRNDLSLGKYNLCVRIDGEEIYKSKEFVISENENTNSKIIITPDKVGWSNSDVTATVTYGSILTENRKGGFGNTLASAKAAANSKNATTIVANETGYFYAEATDTAGNKVTASLQVYIDKIAPTVPTVTAKLNDVNGTAYTAGTWTANSVYVELSSTDTQSGVKSYQWYNNGWTTSGLTTANGKGTITFKDSINQVIRFRTIDIVIAVIVAGIWLIINKNKKSNSNNPALEGEAIEQVGLIDMSNEENAKIENGVKENTSRDLLKDRDIDGITIKNIKLNAEGGISNFTATVQNDSPVDFAGGVAKIKFINQDGSDYAELEVYIPELKVGTTNTIDAGTTADIANAFDFSIELEK